MAEGIKETSSLEVDEIESLSEEEAVASLPVGEFYAHLFGVAPSTTARVRRWPLYWSNNPPTTVNITNKLFAISLLEDANGYPTCEYTFSCVVSAIGYTSTQDGLRSTFKYYINGATGVLDKWFIDVPVHCDTRDQIFTASKKNVPADMFTKMIEPAGGYERRMRRC